MVTYNNEDIDRLIEQAADRAADRVERRVARAAERAVGFYYEKTKHDIDLVLESTDFIKTRLDDMVTRDEFNNLATEVRVIRQAVTDTNKDLRRLEKTVFHA